MEYTYQILLHENQFLVLPSSQHYKLHGKLTYSYKEATRVLSTVPESLQIAFYIKKLS